MLSHHHGRHIIISITMSATSSWEPHHHQVGKCERSGTRECSWKTFSGANNFIHSFIPSFLHSFIPSFLHSFIPSFLHSFIPPFLQSFIHSFIHLFSQSVSQSFIAFPFISFHVFSLLYNSPRIPISKLVLIAMSYFRNFRPEACRALPGI